MVFKNNPEFKYNYRLLTTRFTTETYNDLQRYKENNNITGKSLFNIPIQLRFQNLSCDYPFIILEMNNSENRIMGMGFVLNRPVGMYNRYDVYKDKNYNRYTYKSRFYVSFDEESDDYKNIIEKNNSFVSTIETLNNICFYGKGHLKRGNSFTAIPMKHITVDINNNIMQILLLKYEKKNDTEIIIQLTTFKELKEETINRILNDN